MSIFDDFFFDFDRNFYRFDRNLKDMSPWQIIRNTDKATIVHNVCGVAEEDLKIEIISERGHDYLTISGETKNDVLDKTYSVHSRFEIDRDKIQGIEYKAKDGLLYVDVVYQEAKRPEVKIVKK